MNTASAYAFLLNRPNSPAPLHRRRERAWTTRTFGSPVAFWCAGTRFTAKTGGALPSAAPSRSGVTFAAVAVSRNDESRRPSPGADIAWHSALRMPLHRISMA